jgi:NAD-dependent deacetylase
MSNIEQLQKIIDNSNNIVFFGGAGVSTASGIPDFRGTGGLYNSESTYAYDPEFMLSHTFYKRHTFEFFEFYKDKVCALEYEPNATHYKLAELEKSGKLKAIITQNIDGLHQIAGSKNVIELHGTIYKNHCIKCGKEFTADYVKDALGIPICNTCMTTDAIVRPDITLYEEELPEGVMDKAISYVSKADTLIVAGTSLSVYPAAGLVEYFMGKNLVVINKDKTGQDKNADLVINDDMTKIFSEIVVK